LVLIQDQTQQSEREDALSRTRDDLLQRERLRVLGEIAGAVAHDLGNTLRGAAFQLDAIRSAGKKADGAMLDTVSRHVEIASSVVARLHDFARTGSLTIGRVQLARVIEQAVALADIELASGEHPVRVKVKLPRLPA